MGNLSAHTICWRRSCHAQCSGAGLVIVKRTLCTCCLLCSVTRRRRAAVMPVPFDKLTSHCRAQGSLPAAHAAGALAAHAGAVWSAAAPAAAAAAAAAALPAPGARCPGPPHAGGWGPEARLCIGRAPTRWRRLLCPGEPQGNNINGNHISSLAMFRQGLCTVWCGVVMERAIRAAAYRVHTCAGCLGPDHHTACLCSCHRHRHRFIWQQVWGHLLFTSSCDIATPRLPSWQVIIHSLAAAYSPPMCSTTLCSIAQTYNGISPNHICFGQDTLPPNWQMLLPV